MYEYIEYEPLTMENIFKRVTQEDIFHIIFKDIVISTNQKYKAPYRIDGEAGCFFNRFNNKLYFVDFANTKHHIDCFYMIQLTYKLSFMQTMQYINNYYKLGLGGSNNIISEKYTLLDNTNLELKKKQSIIKFVSKPYTKADQSFWSAFGISSSQLHFDNVVKAKSLKIFSKKKNEWFTIIPKTQTYVYTEFYPRLKIYAPYADKHSKWISNVTKNDIGNINNLPLYGNLLVITKSYKDCRLLRNYGILSVWFQNEGVIPDEEILYLLSKRFNNVVIFYDNDNTGIRTSILLSQIINSNIPNKSSCIYLSEKVKAKDITDYYKLHGRYNTLKTLKDFKLI